MVANPESVFGGTDKLISLIDAIYSTVQDPAKWPAVLARISAALHGESLALFVDFPHTSVPAILGLHEMSPETWEKNARYYAAINPIMPRADALFAAGETIAYSHRVITDRELEATEYYNDFFRPGNMHHSVGLFLPLSGKTCAKLSCQRPRSHGVFDDRAGTVYTTLRPHLARALMLHRRLEGLEAKASGLEATLDAFDHAVFGLDVEGRVVFANRHAESVARAGDALQLCEGRLSAIEHSADHALQALLTAPEAGARSRRHGGSLRIPRPLGKPPLLVTATPFPPSLAGGLVSVVTLLWVVDPARAPLNRSVILNRLYGLTPTETRIAARLLEGQEIREIAERLAMAEGTCRFHVKRILAKTDTSRQTSLMRLMLTLPGYPGEQTGAPS